MPMPAFDVNLTAVESPPPCEIYSKSGMMLCRTATSHFVGNSEQKICFKEFSLEPLRNQLLEQQREKEDDDHHTCSGYFGSSSRHGAQQQQHHQQEELQHQLSVGSSSEASQSQCGSARQARRPRSSSETRIREICVREADFLKHTDADLIKRFEAQERRRKQLEEEQAAAGLKSRVGGLLIRRRGGFAFQARRHSTCSTTSCSSHETSMTTRTAPSPKTTMTNLNLSNGSKSSSCSGRSNSHSSSTNSNNNNSSSSSSRRHSCSGSSPSAASQDVIITPSSGPLPLPSTPTRQRHGEGVLVTRGAAHAKHDLISASLSPIKRGDRRAHSPDFMLAPIEPAQGLHHFLPSPGRWPSKDKEEASLYVGSRHLRSIGGASRNASKLSF
mmetsp:Transcript_62995/g.132948  ORF Transcript_62995/g.132948 Transcript_62995/m.132948 type:complete len:386 (-) Transcript_62995:82-1239(-)